MKIPLAWGVIGLGTLASPAVSAQATLSWQPIQSPLASSLQLTGPWLRPGEPTGAAALSPWTIATPLRLSLQGDIQPIAGRFANCASREEPSGNTINGFPVQRFASLRLSPSLVLTGFSSTGCPVDGGLGGGLTYTIALQPSLRLTASAGVYGVPAHFPNPARIAGDARIDLMKDVGDKRTLSVGVGKRGITFGGGW